MNTKDTHLLEHIVQQYKLALFRQVWLTAGVQPLAVSQMTNRHVQNARHTVSRWLAEAPTEEARFVWQQWKDLLTRELVKRKCPIKPLL